MERDNAKSSIKGSDDDCCDIDNVIDTTGHDIDFNNLYVLDPCGGSYIFPYMEC